MTVDEFIQLRVLPQFHPIVEQIRTYIKEIVPGVNESISYGIPAYKVNKIIAVISPTKVDITLALTHGVEMEDKYNLLRGVGKVGKHIKFKKVEDVKKEVLEYYVKQAVAIDAREKQAKLGKSGK